MSGPPDLLHLLRQWVEKGEHDLVTAEHTLKLKKNCPFDTVCFHAQQCAEKYLKALLVLRSIDFPKNHNLRILMQLIPAEVALGLDSKAVIGLTRYAVDARYPGDWESITRAEAKQAVSIARQVREAVRARLPKEVLK
jgi:HEPN domain-containing protein